MRSKKAAMEMSVGTIVTIVLLVSVLILGIFLVQKIFGSARKVVDLTDEQLTTEINKLFSEEKELAVYPGTRIVQIKQTELDEVGFLITNLLKGTATGNQFSYEVVVSDASDCRETPEQVASWIVVGSQEGMDSGRKIAIPTGSSTLRRTRFRIPAGSSLCVPRFAITVYDGDTVYASDFFDVEVLAA